jgi:16S rRNA (uracil1498-N3)-methyltransferase
MARRRFLVDQIDGDTAELRGEDAHHLARVLRAELDQQYEISDGVHVYLAEVTAITKDRVNFRVLAPIDAPPLPAQVILLAGLIKFDRFEWLIEKTTEIGVSGIIPVNTARSDKGLFEASRKRVERWRRIAHESSQQSRRVSAPEVFEPQQLSQALSTSLANIRYFLDENPGAPALLSVIPPPARISTSDWVALLTGPEGGWTAAERAAASSAGWTPVSLGPLITRAETAAISAASIVLHAWWATQLE